MTLLFLSKQRHDFTEVNRDMTLLLLSKQRHDFTAFK